MDFKVDINVPCKFCGNSACRVYRKGDNIIRYKCFSGCGEYSVSRETGLRSELVDTKPIK